MGKLGDMFYNYMKRLYIRKGVEFGRQEKILWKFWAYVFPYLVFIPLLFWLLKKVIIDYLLIKKGFETMVAYAIILLIMRPMIMEFFIKVMTFREEIKKNL